MKADPWGEGTSWENKIKFMTFLRGCLRLAWSRHPTKLNLLKKKRYKIPNPNPRGNKDSVWGFDCETCKKTFPIKDGQVDHIIPAGSLLEKDDIQGFVERLLWITEDDIRLVCKGCNSALAYSSKQGVSFQQAMVEKEAILLIKEKKDLTWLTDRGIVALRSQKARREQIVEQIIKERTNESTK